MSIQRINYIKQLEYKSYAYKRSLETFPEHLTDRAYKLAVNRYENLLNEKISSPVLTELVLKDVLTKHPVEDKAVFKTNKQTLEKDSRIQFLLAKVTKQETLHNKTQKTRDVLLANNRINAYGINPKLTGLKKIMLRLKLMF